MKTDTTSALIATQPAKPTGGSSANADTQSSNSTEERCISDSGPRPAGVVVPTHYSRYNPQPIEVIEAWGLGFHSGNVVKYLVRAPHKGSELRDLRKARWYLNRLIQIKESGTPPKPDAQA